MSDFNHKHEKVISSFYIYIYTFSFILFLFCTALINRKSKFKMGFELEIQGIVTKFKLVD